VLTVTDIVICITKNSF